MGFKKGRKTTETINVPKAVFEGRTNEEREEIAQGFLDAWIEQNLKTGYVFQDNQEETTVQTQDETSPTYVETLTEGSVTSTTEEVVPV